MLKINFTEAQNKIGFKYDNNGNRYQRYFIGLKPPKDVTEIPGSFSDSTLANDSLRETVSQSDLSEEKMLAMEKGITVYPNPTKDLVMVNLNQSGQKQIGAQIYLYDNSGKQVEQKSYQDVEVGFEMVNKPPGNYHLKVLFNDGKIINYTVIKVN